MQLSERYGQLHVRIGRSALERHLERMLGAPAIIEREPGGDLSTARLAAVAGIGARALQRNFREYVGASPQEYVRAVRLSRTHDDLAGGAGGTVAEIAFRWGFTHVSRFAGAYQERYGLAPSATLRGGPAN